MQRLTKIQSFINKYNWKGINFLLKKDDQKKFEKISLTNSLNVQYAKNDKIHPAFVSKHKSNCEKQFILLAILNGEGWHYLTVKKTISVITKSNV